MPPLPQPPTFLAPLCRRFAANDLQDERLYKVAFTFWLSALRDHLAWIEDQGEGITEWVIGVLQSNGQGTLPAPVKWELLEFFNLRLPPPQRPGRDLPRTFEEVNRQCPSCVQIQPKEHNRTTCPTGLGVEVWYGKLWLELPQSDKDRMMGQRDSNGGRDWGKTYGFPGWDAIRQDDTLIPVPISFRRCTTVTVAGTTAGTVPKPAGPGKGKGKAKAAVASKSGSNPAPKRKASPALAPATTASTSTTCNNAAASTSTSASVPFPPPKDDTPGPSTGGTPPTDPSVGSVSGEGFEAGVQDAHARKKTRRDRRLKERVEQKREKESKLDDAYPQVAPLVQKQKNSPLYMNANNVSIACSTLPPLGSNNIIHVPSDTTDPLERALEKLVTDTEDAVTYAARTMHGAESMMGEPVPDGRKLLETVLDEAAYMDERLSGS